MTFMSHQLKKLKLTLFAPTKFLCNSKVSSIPNYNCHTKINAISSPVTSSTTKRKRKCDNDHINNSSDSIKTSSTKLRYHQQQQLSKNSPHNTDSRDSSHQRGAVKDLAATEKEVQRDYSPLAEPSPRSTLATDNHAAYMKEEESNMSAKHIHLSPMYEHPNQHDKKKLCSALKRLLQPYKTFYELEWNIPNYANATTSKVWLQLDKHTSSGIERIRQLGFSDLDVRLDDNLTTYINKCVLVDKKVESILIEILFRNSDFHCDRKDSMLQPSSSRSSDTLEKKDYRQNMHLLRLRRVHWWTKDYNLARASCVY